MASEMALKSAGRTRSPLWAASSLLAHAEWTCILHSSPDCLASWSCALCSQPVKLLLGMVAGRQALTRQDVQLKGDVRMIVSTQFATPWSLRFPRIVNIHRDKRPQDISTVTEMLDEWRGKLDTTKSTPHLG